MILHSSVRLWTTGRSKRLSQIVRFWNTHPAALCYCAGMNEQEAKTLAELIAGDEWMSGGGIWLVLKRTSDGRVISISKEVVVEYANEEAFQDDRRSQEIVLA